MKPWMIITALAIATLGIPAALSMTCGNGGCSHHRLQGDAHAVPGQPVWIDCGITMDCLRW